VILSVATIDLSQTAAILLIFGIEWDVGTLTIIFWPKLKGFGLVESFLGMELII
jgi:hypothetical protein